jgi:hypothetical protein
LNKNRNKPIIKDTIMQSNKYSGWILFPLAILGSCHILVSCGKTNGRISQHNHIIYNIDNSDEGNHFSWDHLVTIEKIIPLETNNYSSMGNIYKGQITKNKIALLDMNSNLMVFDLNGQFLFKIGNKGHGPGEFLHIRDFMVLDDEILILDYKRIHCYASVDGNYLRTIILNIRDEIFNPGNFLVFDSCRLYLWDGSDENYPLKKDAYRLVFMKECRFEASFFKNNHPCLAHNRFSQGPEGHFFMGPNDGDNKVYELTRDSISVAFELKFSKKELPLNYFVQNRIEDMNEYLRSNYYKAISNIFVTGSYAYFKCIGPNANGYEGLIDKNSKEVMFGKAAPLLNPNIFYSDGDCLYGYFSPVQLLKSKDISNSCFDRVKDTLKNLSDNDNIVVIKLSLKTPLDTE